MITPAQAMQRLLSDPSKPVVATTACSPIAVRDGRFDDLLPSWQQSCMAGAARLSGVGRLCGGLSFLAARPGYVQNAP